MKEIATIKSSRINKNGTSFIHKFETKKNLGVFFDPIEITGVVQVQFNNVSGFWDWSPMCTAHEIIVLKKAIEDDEKAWF